MKTPNHCKENDCHFYAIETWNGWARYHGRIHWGTYATMEVALHGARIFNNMTCVVTS